MCFSSDFQPSITYWFFGTVTGITGILLVVVMSVMYVFAAPSIINNAYHAFRVTHLLNILLYTLAIAHGLPKLLDVSIVHQVNWYRVWVFLQSPRFGYYILVPSILFVFDRIMGLKQEYKKLDIIAAELLPSGIEKLKLLTKWFYSILKSLQMSSTSNSSAHATLPSRVASGSGFDVRHWVVILTNGTHFHWRQPPRNLFWRFTWRHRVLGRGSWNMKLLMFIIRLDSIPV